MNYQKKVEAISTKGLTKDLINKFSIYNGAKYFSLEAFQNYLVFIPAKKYIKYFSGTTRIDSRKSNGMSEENIEIITKSDSNFPPTFVDHHLLPEINFNGHCLINNISIPKNISLYIFYTLNPQLNTDFTLGNYLFGSVKKTKNAYLDKYKIGTITLIITEKIYEFFGEGPTQELNDTTLTGEAKYPINFK